MLIIVEMYPPDYIQVVLEEYRRKVVAGQLPLGLIQLSPAKIKEACLEVCRDRYEPKDGKILKTFFGDSADREACLRAIDRCEIDKFRPLIKFLKGTITVTDGKNIELLAWLIDFTDRPWQMGKKYATDIVPDQVEQSLNEGGSIEVDREEPKKQGSALNSYREPILTPLKATITHPKFSKAMFPVSMILVTVGIGVWIWVNKTIVRVPTGPQACMYWAGDHYEQVSCNVHFTDTVVIALDSGKLVHFRKITQPDTITSNSIGSVWYVRYRKDYEYYTADGYHPIDPTLRLRPITEYIIRNHIHPNQ
jgi:hypothetical protein